MPMQPMMDKKQADAMHKEMHPKGTKTNRKKGK